MRQNLVNRVVSLINLIKIFHQLLVFFLFNLLLVFHIVVFKIEFTVESNICFLRVMRVHYLGRMPHQHVILRATIKMLVRLRIDPRHHHVVVFDFWLKVRHSTVSKEARRQRTLEDSHLLIHLNLLLNRAFRQEAYTLVEIWCHQPSVIISLSERIVNVWISHGEGDNRATDLKGIRELFFERKNVLEKY